jgi:hypothetical protein
MIQFPHRVQQIMSAEKYPTLSGAIPAFEMFMTAWETLIQGNAHLKPLVDPGLEWTYMYYARMDRTKAYVIAMCKWLILDSNELQLPTAKDFI